MKMDNANVSSAHSLTQSLTHTHIINFECVIFSKCRSFHWCFVYFMRQLHMTLFCLHLGNRSNYNFRYQKFIDICKNWVQIEAFDNLHSIHRGERERERKYDRKWFANLVDWMWINCLNNTGGKVRNHHMSDLEGGWAYET